MKNWNVSAELYLHSHVSQGRQTTPVYHSHVTYCQQEVVEQTVPLCRSLLVSGVSSALHFFNLAIRQITQITNRQQSQIRVFGSINDHCWYLNTTHTIVSDAT